MKVYFAPLEGVTAYPFRLAHARYFTAADKYFAPFISPTQEHVLAPRDYRELCPEHNEGVVTVPQLLGKNAADLIWAIGELHALGYEEVNLNLGCPSGTVVTKGKGAGLLRDLEALDELLSALYSASPCRLSIKTRLGMEREEEFFALLEIYSRYPVSELIVHARVREDYYKKPVREDFFAEIYKNCPLPLCFNGDICGREDMERISARFPNMRAVMLGRGLVAAPSLLGERATKEAVRGFHDDIYAACRRDFGSARSAMFRMKELWSYLRHSFTDCDRQMKRLLKSRDEAEYLSAAASLIQDCPLAEAPRFPLSY